ncbi:MAG: CinA family protein [Pseudomonadota bacterium]
MKNKNLSLLVLEKLKKQKRTISFAESITGGNISGEFVKNVGASKVFMGGIIAYSDDAKKKLLGVKQNTLNNYGAVSEKTVKEMCTGLKKLFNTDITISISGIAGPDGGTKQKPVGTVYFGFMFGKKFYAKKEIFHGSRVYIMLRAINKVFTEILKN